MEKYCAYLCYNMQYAFVYYHCVFNIYIYIHIYKQYFIYRKHFYMFRCTRTIFREYYPSALIQL